jgi:hypothetical protein
MSMVPSAFYTLSSEGVLDGDVAEWFNGLTVSYPAEGPRRTVLSGTVANQAALHRLLNKIRDLNLQFIAEEQKPGDPSYASPAA